jgi:hypothetical protein
MSEDLEKRKAIENEVESKDSKIEIEDLESFLRDNFDDIFAMVEVIRHGHTEYTGKYPDITPEGEAALRVAAGEIAESVSTYDKLAKENHSEVPQSLLYLTSPSTRAVGSLDVIKNKINESLSKVSVDEEDISHMNAAAPGEEYRRRRSIRSLYTSGGDDEAVDQLFLGWSKARDMEHWNEDIETQRNSDYAYINEGDRRDDLIETPLEVEKRVFNDLKHSYKVLHRYREKFDKIPHAIVATHFETIAPLLIKGFESSSERDKLELAERGEKVTLYFLESKSPNTASMVINFRDKSVKVDFDLETKQFN